MTDWSYSKIETHDEDARERYTSQYDSADNLKNLSTLWAERVQGLEDAAWQVLTETWLDVAVGAQLDELGVMVGEPRLGRSDQTYRDAIELRVSINRSGGEPERIIEFLTRVLNADKVLYQELYPAKIQIFIDGEIDFDAAERVRQLVPAGVGSIFISSTDGEIPFGTIELGGAPEPDIDGFGELGLYALEVEPGVVLAFGDGTIMGMNDSEDYFVIGGGHLAELYEV